VKADSIGETLLRFRRPTGVVLAGATLLMAVCAARVDIRTRFIDFFPANHENVALSKRFAEFGGDETLVVMVQVKQGNIFNLKTLRKIQKITSEVDCLPGINHKQVFSLSSRRIAYAREVPGAIKIRPFMFPSVPHDKADIEALKLRVLAHRELVRHLISDDDKSALITASFNHEKFEYPDLCRRVRRIARENQDAHHDIYVAGEPVVRGYEYYDLPAIVGVFVLAWLMMMLVLYANLGAYTAWWVPVVTASCAAVWGLGFVGLMGYSFDPLMLVVPFILTARDMSHGIGWQRCYYTVVNQLEDRHAACVKTTNLMLAPGLVAITADLTGIIFISFCGIPVLDHTARAGVVWLGASVLMVYIFQPILMSYLPMPRVNWNLEVKRELSRHVEPLVESFVEVPVTPGWPRKLLLSVSVGLLISGVISALRIQVGYNQAGTPLYRREAKVNTDAEAIAREFPADEGWVLLTTPPYPDPQSVFAPNVLRLADDLRSYLLNDPAVKQVISFASTVIRPLNQIFHYGHPKFFGMPKDPLEAGDLWNYYHFLNGTARGAIRHCLPGSDGKETWIGVMLRDDSARTLRRTQREIGAFLKSYAEGRSAYSKVRVSYMAGLAGLYGAANDVLYRVAMVNIGLVLLCAFALGTVLFRSWLAGFIFLFCCVLANFSAFIYMYLTGIRLTVASVPVISLAMGLGVDYGISTLSCVRNELGAGYRLDDAIRLALESACQSELSSFCVMLGGLLPWVFSPFLLHHQMSIVLIILLIANVLASLWITAAFISWWKPDFITRYEWRPEGKLGRAVTGRGATGRGLMPSATYAQLRSARPTCIQTALNRMRSRRVPRAPA
jgi:predicted RND superfamily exporter protein